jgi:outer membrane biosynthesis protein TonB
MKEFLYCTTNAVTVRHAALLNAINSLTVKPVYDELVKTMDIQSKKPMTYDIEAEIYILKRDSCWVKKMFMGKEGVTIESKPTKPKSKPKSKPKPKVPKVPKSKPKVTSKPKSKPKSKSKPKAPTK